MEPVSWILVAVVFVTSGLGWFSNNKKNEAVLEAEKAQQEVVQVKAEQEKAQAVFLQSIEDTKKKFKEQEAKTGNLAYVIDGQAQVIKTSYPEDKKTAIHADTTEQLSKQVPPEAGFRPSGLTLFEAQFLTGQQQNLKTAIEEKEQAIIREKILQEKLLEKEQKLNSALGEVSKWTGIASEKEKERTGLARFVEDLIKACVVIGVLCLGVYLWLWWRGLGLKKALALKDQGLKLYDKAVAEFGLMSDEGNKDLAELLEKHNIHVPSILQKDKYRSGIRTVDRPTDPKNKHP